MHGMKVKNSDGRIVTFPEVQFGFTPERGTIDAVFIFRNLQKECHANGRNYVCLVDLRKLLTEYKGVLEWVMKKKEIPEVFVGSAMSLYEGAKTRV